jgi:hypothetical protein
VRRTLEEITGTKQFDKLRLKCFSDKADKRRREQLAAKRIHDTVGGSTWLDADATEILGDALAWQELWDSDPTNSLGPAAYTSVSTWPLHATSNTYQYDIGTLHFGLQTFQAVDSLSKDQLTADVSAPEAAGRPPPDRRSLRDHAEPSEPVPPNTALDQAQQEMSSHDREQKYTRSHRQGREDTAKLTSEAISEKMDALTDGSGYYAHISRAWTLRADTLASRLSSSSSTFYGASTFESSEDNYFDFQFMQKANERLRHPRTANSEYKRFYHNEHIIQFEDGLPAIHVVLYARSLPDEEAARMMNCSLAQVSGDKATWINAHDERGVSALHLAVAFGLIAVCASLVKNGADVTAKTHEGTTIARFSKAAERLASDERLYFRITHCREWVKQGLAPPIPIPTPPPRRHRAVAPEQLQEDLNTMTIPLQHCPHHFPAKSICTECMETGPGQLRTAQVVTHPDLLMQPQRRIEFASLQSVRPSTNHTNNVFNPMETLGHEHLETISRGQHRRLKPKTGSGLPRAATLMQMPHYNSPRKPNTQQPLLNQSTPNLLYTAPQALQNNRLNFPAGGQAWSIPTTSSANIDPLELGYGPTAGTYPSNNTTMNVSTQESMPASASLMTSPLALAPQTTHLVSTGQQQYQAFSRPAHGAHLTANPTVEPPSLDEEP